MTRFHNSEGTLLTWLVGVNLTLGVASRVSTPEWGRQTPLAEGVETRQEFGLPVVEAQLADGTRIHETDCALLFQSLFSRWQTFCLVFHDDDNVVVVKSFGTFVHCFSCCPPIVKISAAAATKEQLIIFPT